MPDTEVCKNRKVLLLVRLADKDRGAECSIDAIKAVKATRSSGCLRSKGTIEDRNGMDNASSFRVMDA